MLGDESTTKASTLLSLGSVNLGLDMVTSANLCDLMLVGFLSSVKTLMFL